MEGDHAEVARTRPTRDLVRELRLAQDLRSAADWPLRAPEGRCNEHLSKEFGVRCFGRANDKSHGVHCYR